MKADLEFARGWPLAAARARVSVSADIDHERRRACHDLRNRIPVGHKVCHVPRVVGTGRAAMLRALCRPAAVIGLTRCKSKPAFAVR